MVDIPRQPIYIPRPPPLLTSGFVASSADALTSVKPPRFQPFQFWPEPRPPRKWEDDRLQFVLGSPVCLVHLNPKPQQLPIWPESRPPHKAEEYLVQFTLGTPTTITGSSVK